MFCLLLRLGNIRRAALNGKIFAWDSRQRQQVPAILRLCGNATHHPSSRRRRQS
jgi:hypothetical protein